MRLDSADAIELEVQFQVRSLGRRAREASKQGLHYQVFGLVSFFVPFSHELMGSSQFVSFLDLIAFRLQRAGFNVSSRPLYQFRANSRSVVLKVV